MTETPKRRGDVLGVAGGLPPSPPPSSEGGTAITDFVFRVCSRCGYPPSDGPCIMGNEEHAETWPKRYASYSAVTDSLSHERKLRKEAERRRDDWRKTALALKESSEAGITSFEQAEALLREEGERVEALKDGLRLLKKAVWDQRPWNASERAIANAATAIADTLLKESEQDRSRVRAFLGTEQR